MCNYEFPQNEKSESRNHRYTIQTYLNVSKRAISLQFCPGGPIPHNLAQGFDAPPTLERSGSEHRVGRLHPLVPEGREAW